MYLKNMFIYIYNQSKFGLLIQANMYILIWNNYFISNVSVDNFNFRLNSFLLQQAIWCQPSIHINWKSNQKISPQRMIKQLQKQVWFMT